MRQLDRLKSCGKPMPHLSRERRRPRTGANGTGCSQSGALRAIRCSIRSTNVKESDSLQEHDGMELRFRRSHAAPMNRVKIGI